jgi:hypothetical protein
MRIRRSLPIFLAFLIFVAAVALIVSLRKHAPPEAARLLPGADGFFYINLKWIRTFSSAKQIPRVFGGPEYEELVKGTGFEFERDLDEAAFAVHYPQTWGDGTGGAAQEPRFSEVFVGKIDSTKLTSYLRPLSSSVENYRGFDIYNVPREGRTVRVAILSYDAVAVSNHPDGNVIRGILDRSRKAASPFGGPMFLRQYYKQVPLASLSWAILRVKPAQLSSLGGLGLWAMFFPKPAVTVISGRYIRAVHLRAEAFTDSDADAQALVEKAGAFMNVFRSAEVSVGTQGTDEDVKAFFDSLKVERSGSRAVLTAKVPPGFVRKLLSETPSEGQIPAPAPPADSPAAPEPTKKK